MKLTNNTEKLLKILIITVAFVLFSILIGVMTRSSTIQQVYSDQFSFYELRESARRKISNRIFEQGFTLSEKLWEAKIEYLTQEVRKKQMASLSSADLYTNYAYEIAKFRYPDVDPEYVCAIIYHESRFDPTQTNSRTGVQGLTQINPKWHTKRARSLGVENLYDPYGNILVCFDILNELAQKNGFEYALNFYAGGYPYANRYRNSQSPFISQLREIMDSQKFPSRVLPYPVTENGGAMNAAS